jgi:hypothetical protein
MSALGYDRPRVAALLARAQAASTHLAASRSDDPAAAIAVATSEVVLGHLDAGWLPSLRAVLASEALLTWHGAAVFGDLLGQALAEHAAHLTNSEFAEFADALEAATGDRAALAAFVSALGTDGLIALTSRIVTAASTTGADELAPVLREVVVIAATALPATFGADLVHATAAARRRRPADCAAGAALGYLFAGGQLPTSTLVASAEALHDAEADYARNIGLDPSSEGDALWSQPWLPILEGPLLDDGFDPAYAILRQVGHDGAAARHLFTDEDMATYFFAHRPITADGGRAVSGAAAAGATDGVDASSLHDAMFVASAFVNLAAPAHADEMLDDPDAETSAAVAAILGGHLQSVQLAGSSGRVGVVTATHEALGPNGAQLRAQFDSSALEAMLDVAADTSEGVVSLRASLTTFQNEVATVAAARVARGDIEPERVADFLKEAMTDAARLEGMFASHVGHRGEHHGRDRDRELSFWVDGLGSAVQLGTSPIGGNVVSSVVGQGVGPVQDELLARFAHHEADAAAGAAALTQDATDRLMYVWVRALFNAGVIVPNLPPRLLVGGQLPAFDDLPDRLADVNAHDPDPDHATYDLQSLLNAMDVTAGAHGATLDDGAITDAVKAAQLPIYEELD